VKSHRASHAAAALGLLLALGLGSPAAAQRVCLALETEQQMAVHPIAVGDALHLSFRHSIYGSAVEEQFQIARDGFRANRLRYAERRLVEFYGHESATNEHGWWVVHNPGREFPTLDLRVSRESSIRVTFSNRTISLQKDNALEGRLRLSVNACPGENHG
jgi:hypothetical protein